MQRKSYSSVFKGINNFRNPGILPEERWDDREKLYDDLEDINYIYEEILTALASKLNFIHEVDHPKEYWRILIGPWLQIYVNVFFYYWFNGGMSVQKERPLAVYLTIINESIALNDTHEFVMAAEDGRFMDFLVNGSLDSYEAVSAISENGIKKKSSKYNENSQTCSIKSCVLSSIKKLFEYIPRFFKDCEYFIYSGQLGLFFTVELHFLLKQMPRLYNESPVPRFDYSPIYRTWSIENIATKSTLSDFIEFALAFIPKTMPRVYLEGYSYLIEKSQSLSWPKKPRLIFTTMAQFYDEVFKLWMAEKRESGAIVVLGQHGGSYGMKPFSPAEEHEILISDAYLTWGWNEYRNSVVPYGTFIQKPREVVYEENFKKGLLLVMPPLGQDLYRVGYGLASSNQKLEFLSNILKFIDSIDVKTLGESTIRYYPATPINFINFSKREYPLFNHDVKPKASVFGAMTDCRILVSTYNSTAYLESMSVNFPTVIFWDPKYSELRDEAQPYFEELKKAGIFHESYQSAAHHVMAISSNIGAWWRSRSTQKARSIFCNNYVRDRGRVSNLADILKNIASGS